MRIAVLCCLLLLNVFVKAQTNEWQVFNTQTSGLPDNQVQVIAIDDSNNKWFGTTKGLVRYNGNTWQVFNTSNSGIPSDEIYSLKADGRDLWVGTLKGLAKYDGSNWAVFDNTASIFLSPLIIEITKDNENNFLVASELNLVKFSGSTWNVIDNMEFVGPLQSIAVDSSNHIWVGDFDLDSHMGILWHYDGQSWIPTSLRHHEELISSFPYALTVDRNNVLWMGTGGTPPGALVRIENNKWELHRYDNSGLPRSGVSYILIEDSIKWIGTAEGLIYYDDKNWKIFNTDNSGLPDDWVYTLAIDKLGNKWIGTINGGAAVYKEGGIVTSVERNQNKPAEYGLLFNYPNPFNPVTKIIFSINKLSFVRLEILNILGEVVSEIYSGIRNSGEYEISFNASGLSAGIYFCRLECFDPEEGKSYQNILKISYLK
ncbi:MAG: T9SS type A sorting domain-containing protein [Ignavibacteriaceae bacterium]